MITKLKIENYKSIQELTFDVGRLNVLIGENGCGKSNILEAITFAAAAEANKLDNEFLVSRGIRITEPKLMRAIFKNSSQSEDSIKITFKFSTFTSQFYILDNYNFPYSKWIYERLDEERENKRVKKLEEIENNKLDTDLNPDNEIYLAVAKNQSLLLNEKKEISDFIIYSPENTSLRDFYKEGRIEPLGINGEGLLKLLTVTQDNAKKSQQEFTSLDDIKETLNLFGWFESIKIPDDFSQLEKKITIKDHYLALPFDQRSANEGFLLVLFYITLVVSKYTPKIFAIDNIDTSLNPKLCTKLIKELTRLAKKYDKQLFVTSHNPAILDGIDLSDDEQRLFVVSRNKQGHTRCKRIEVKDKPKSSVRDMLSRLFNDNKAYNKDDILNIFDNEGDPLDISYAFSKMFKDNEVYTKDDILNKFDNSEEPVKLSYAFLRGYLGGLPKNF